MRVGVILAGGRASRMGGEKAFALLHGRPLIVHAIERARPQVDELIVNANDAARFAPFGCTVVPDATGEHAGPLAGVLAALHWVAGHRRFAGWLASFACDAPFFPADMVARLVAAAEAENAAIALAASGAQHHPVFAVWRPALSAKLEQAMKAGVRKVDDFIALCPHVQVRFALGACDPFFNINTPDDLARAETMHD